MPADRLAMHHIRDILRLRHDAGLSLREIARSLNLSLGVVSKYLQLAADAGLGWPLPAELDEQTLARKLQPPAAANPTPLPLPNFPDLHHQMRRKGITLQLLWEEYAEANPAGLPQADRRQDSLTAGLILNSHLSKEFPGKLCEALPFDFETI